MATDTRTNRGVDLEQRILDFVVRESASKPGSVDRETSLAGNLGLDGADAEEFLESYSKEFAVDLFGFDFHEHFADEGHSVTDGAILLIGIGLLVWLWQESPTWMIGAVLGIVLETWLVRRWQRADPATLRVGHLVEAARRGYWSRTSA